MKKAALTVLASAALISFGPSCAKHSWKETQSLHEGMHKDHGHGDSHEAHGDAKHEAHGEAKHDTHGKADAHAAPAAAGHEEKKAH